MLPSTTGCMVAGGDAVMSAKPHLWNPQGGCVKHLIPDGSAMASQPPSPSQKQFWVFLHGN